MNKAVIIAVIAAAIAATLADRFWVKSNNLD